MGEVANDESIVVGVVGHQANTVTARSIGVQDTCIVDTNVDLVADGLDEAFLESSSFSDISDIAGSGIRDLVTFTVSLEQLRMGEDSCTF